MILVTVGNDRQPFERLMGWLDLLLGQGLIREELVVELGACRVVPSGARIYRQLSDGERFRLAAQSRLVVAHCDEGSLQWLGTLEVPFILVPRSRRFGEHVDDHQVELASALEFFQVPIAWSPADLVRFIDQPRAAGLGDLAAATSRALCTSLFRRFPAPRAAGNPESVR